MWINVNVRVLNEIIRTLENLKNTYIPTLSHFLLYTFK